MTEPTHNGTALARSSYSGSTGGHCVEVAADGDGDVRVRDSKDPAGPRLAFAPGPWTAFLRGISSSVADT